MVILKSRKKLRKFILITFLVMLIVINIGGFYIGNVFYDKVCKMSFDKNSDSYSMFKSTFDYVRFDSLSKEEVTINSSFGYKLSGTYIYNSVPSSSTVIIVHGITGSRWESMKYADIYLNLGFNVLIYDSRYHGKSGGGNISLGYYEKDDLESCVQWVKKKNQGGIIGIHGESMGAATALLHANMNESKKEVSFYIADCPYSDITQLFKEKLTEEIKPHSNIISDLIVFYSSMVVVYRSGFSLYAISPIKAIENVRTPIMFIHGADDDFISPVMSMDLYANKKYGPKYLYIAPNAGHAQSYLKNKDEYTAKVDQFLKSIKIINVPTKNTKN